MRVTHDPNANLDYTVDWADWLVDGETISSSTWIVPTGLTAGVASHDTTTAWCWISGGTAGADSDYALSRPVHPASDSQSDDRGSTPLGGII
jgi:hypothetical protein